ncbi:MAG: DUF3050 domain-containing protein [Chromatiales bacterium]|jgi:hypothetical protein
MARFNPDCVRSLKDELDRHPVYDSLGTMADLRVFMGHHVFSVWDFMSLIKYLQRHIAPVQVPWMPSGDAELRYFINQLVLEEESDEVPRPQGGVTYASHFESYCAAMNEIGADGERPLRFLALVREKGLDAALYSDLVPVPARYFCETTFGLVRNDRPHEVAAALALGREQVIPGMFRRFLERMGVTPADAPTFHFYLNRHIHLDEDFHGPLSMRLLDELCQGDAARVAEAEAAAEEALCARIRFWDGVVEAVKARAEAA